MNHKGNIPILNALRGFAAVGVFICHSATEAFPLRSGAVFVDIFMALSGFLMCYNYIRRENRELWERPSTIGKFYLSRFFRIAPVYYACLLYFYLIHWSPEIGGGVSLTWNIIQHVTFIFGLYQNPPTTFMPDWSIALEMQFYLLFPFLMLLIRKIGIIWLVITSTIICWSFKQFYGVYDTPGLWGSYHQPTILPLKFTLFTYGMLMAYVYCQRAERPWFVYLLLALICALPFENGHSWGVLGLMGIILALDASVLFKRKLRILFGAVNHYCDNRFFLWLADVSYGLYLMHGFVFLVLHQKMQSVAMAYGPGMNWLIILGTAALILVPITSLSYWLFEKPCIGLGRRLLHRSP
jgi:peptidoglycan/LPS O-acetylase OafA/YrhL